MYAIVGFCASCAKNTFTLDDIFSSTWVLGQEFFSRISNALYWYECHLYSHLNRQPTEEIFKFILAQFSWYSLVAVVPLSPTNLHPRRRQIFIEKVTFLTETKNRHIHRIIYPQISQKTKIYENLSPMNLKDCIITSTEYFIMTSHST